MEKSKNELYNKCGCPNCWYIITVLDPDKTYVCPRCGRKGEELVELAKEYHASFKNSDKEAN